MQLIYLTYNIEFNCKKSNVFHDRFIVVDKKIAYTIGSSLKDAGKKCFAIIQIKDSAVINNLIQKVNQL